MEPQNLDLFYATIEIENLKAQRDALLAACEFYANEENWEFPMRPPEHLDWDPEPSKVIDDDGKIARAALALTRNEDEDEDPSLTDDFGAFEVIDGADYSDID